MTVEATRAESAICSAAAQGWARPGVTWGGWGGWSVPAWCEFAVLATLGVIALAVGALQFRRTD